MTTTRSHDRQHFLERRAHPRTSEARWRSPVPDAVSEPGMVNPRDWLLIRELSSQWGISMDLVCAAAAQLGSNATIPAVHRLAVKTRDASGEGTPTS